MARQIKINGFEATIGNHKLGMDTLIFNMGSATSCPAKALGMCKVASKCYALQAENQYPAVIKYRNRQEAYWLNTDASNITKSIVAALHKKSKVNGAMAPLMDTIKFIRFNESGDFHSQACVDKMESIAKVMSYFNITCYGYTARKDLDYTRAKHLIVRGSGWSGPNGKTIVISKHDKAPIGYNLCPGSCKVCNLCKVPLGNIAFNLH